MNNYAAWGCAVGNPRSEHQLDIIFVHASGFHPNATREPCRLYKQRSSSPQLERITGYHFTDTLAPYTVPYWSDYDLDGDMDLFIASGPAGTPGPDFCYRNMRIETGRDTLVRMTTELFASQAQDGQCYNFIDIDNDGDLDLCLTNYAGVSTRMYRNNNGVWTLLPTPFSAVARNLANCWGDYDNDGDLDVIITSDNAVSKYYRNDGDGTFTYLANGFTTPAGASGIASCDYDNDGDLDLFVNGKTPATGLFRNDTVAGTRTWVNLKLVGVESNASAIGAIVRIKAPMDGEPVWQLREINAQNSFQSQNDLRVHFGLKNAGTIDSLMINWPSGHRDVITNLPVNTFYRVVEGAGIPSLSIPTDKKVDQTAVTIYPNPAGDRIEIMLEGQDTSVAYDISDITGRQIQSGNASTSQPYIDISGLRSGTYSIVIRTPKGIVYRSMIKK